MRRHLLALLVPALAATLPCCYFEKAEPDANAVQGSAPPNVPPAVLSATQKLAIALTTTPFAEGELPAGVRSDGGERSRPSEKLLKLNAEAKVTLNLRGSHASERLSYTVYATPADAQKGFALIGEPVPDRNVLSSEPQAFEAPAPGFGESAIEEYQGRKIRRTTLATLSGHSVVLAQVIVELKEGDATAPPRDYALELLRGGVRHLERLAGDAPATAAAPAAAPYSAAPATY